jgi:hypothetical protein
MEQLIPWLYLKGVSTGEFTDALAVLVGKDAPGLSAHNLLVILERYLQQNGIKNKKENNRRHTSLESALNGKRKKYEWYWATSFGGRKSR